MWAQKNRRKCQDTVSINGQKKQGLIPWNNWNRDPSWGVAEIQKMSPPTTVGDAAAMLSNKGVPQFWEM